MGDEILDIHALSNAVSLSLSISVSVCHRDILQLDGRQL